MSPVEECAPRSEEGWRECSCFPQINQLKLTSRGAHRVARGYITDIPLSDPVRATQPLQSTFCLHISYRESETRFNKNSLLQLKVCDAYMPQKVLCETILGNEGEHLGYGMTQLPPDQISHTMDFRRIITAFIRLLSASLVHIMHQKM